MAAAAAATGEREEDEFSFSFRLRSRPHLFSLFLSRPLFSLVLSTLSSSLNPPLLQKNHPQVGPELELTGYGCEDHFLEPDTEDHAWRCLAELLCSGVADGKKSGGDGKDTAAAAADAGESRGRGTNNDDDDDTTSSSSSSNSSILIDIGLVATHAGASYNVRVFCLDGRSCSCAPSRRWPTTATTVSRATSALGGRARARDLSLPRSFTETMREVLCRGSKETETGVQPQETAPIGHAILALDDATLAAESCEELFTPCPPHVALALAGCEMVSNGSGSHHQLRKLDEQRLSLLREATRRCGGVYLYANQRGCDGGRLYYDGCACVLANGTLVAQGAQFGLRDVEVVVADVDLDDVAAFRGGVASAQEQAAGCFGGGWSGGGVSTFGAAAPPAAASSASHPRPPRPLPRRRLPRSVPHPGRPRPSHPPPPRRRSPSAPRPGSGTTCAGAAPAGFCCRCPGARTRRRWRRSSGLCVRWWSMPRWSRGTRGWWRTRGGSRAWTWRRWGEEEWRADGGEDGVETRNHLASSPSLLLPAAASSTPAATRAWLSLARSLAGALLTTVYLASTEASRAGDPRQGGEAGRGGRVRAQGGGDRRRGGGAAGPRRATRWGVVRLRGRGRGKGEKRSRTGKVF